jgi:hypothetical protein
LALSEEKIGTIFDALRLVDFLTEKEAFAYTLRIAKHYDAAKLAAAAKATPVTRAAVGRPVGVQDQDTKPRAKRRKRCPAGCGKLFDSAHKFTYHMASAHGRDVRPYRRDPAFPNKQLALTSEDSAKFVAWVQRYGTSAGYLKGIPPGSHLHQAGA